MVSLGPMQIRTPHQLGSTVRGRRLMLRASQAEVAQAARVSRSWLSDFEAGKPTVEIARVLSVLAVLGFTLDLRAPGEGPAEPAPAYGPGELLDLLLEDYIRGVGGSSRAVDQ